MDRIAQMTAFVRVVEAGNFTKAADTLNLPNPTVTRLIQALEQHLQVRLLHRTTRAVTVTPEGATYYERVVRLLADLTDIESSAKQTRAKPSGRIRVESATALGTMVILPALGEFYKAYPDVTVELSIGNRHADIVAEGIDCVIRADKVAEQYLVARRIGEFQYVTCATPGFVSAHGAPATPQEIQQRPSVGMTSMATGRAIPFRFSDGQTEITPPLSHVLEVNDTNAYLAAGLAGLGIIQAPAFIVQAAIESGKLVPFLQEWRTRTMPVHVIYAPNRYLSAKVRVFIDWVVALFERHDSLKLGSIPDSQSFQSQVEESRTGASPP